jgi:uncharacterized protein (DUF2336 family)
VSATQTRAAEAYEEAKRLLRDPNPRVRERLARRPDLQPELLYFLAEDADSEVRRQVAANPATPPHAHPLLARDQAVEVRSTLADKIARLVPDLDPDVRGKVYQFTLETLEILARDQAVRVRQILSEILKDVAKAPAEIIQRLARDADTLVSVPVLQFSPVLTDHDLIEIIRSAPAHRALTAITRRLRLGETVADAIVGTRDETVIASLLANPSAQIREETLDYIVGEAPSVPAWHSPLVDRPSLPKRVMVALARFVASMLVDRLLERADLDAATAQQVREIVEQRLEEEPEAAPPEDPLATALRLKESGALDEAAVGNALAQSNRPLTMAMLAVLASRPLSVVKRIITGQSARGTTALAWKAGLSMRIAIDLQKHLARVPAAQLLYAREGVHFPMSPADMEWQLEFFDG